MDWGKCLGSGTNSRRSPDVGKIHQGSNVRKRISEIDRSNTSPSSESPTDDMECEVLSVIGVKTLTTIIVQRVTIQPRLSLLSVVYNSACILLCARWAWRARGGRGDIKCVFP